jgi:hypothetical protein
VAFLLAPGERSVIETGLAAFRENAAEAIRHSKNADAPYADDTAERRAAASDLQRTVETIVGATLAALEARPL